MDLTRNFFLDKAGFPHMHDYLPMHHGDDLIGCSNFRTQCSIDDLEIQETGDGYFSLYIKKDN